MINRKASHPGAIPVWKFLLTYLAVALLSNPAAPQSCGVGKTRSGGECVYKNICKDGRAWIDGKCLDYCWDGSRYYGSCPGVADTTPTSGRQQKPVEPHRDLPPVQKIGSPDVPEIKSPDVPEIKSPDVPEIKSPDVPEIKSPPIKPINKLSECAVGAMFDELTSKATASRRLLMVGGAAVTLFERYLSDCTSSGYNPDLTQIKIFIPAGGDFTILDGSEHAKLSFGEMLAGKSQRAKWLEVLEGINAEAVQTPENEAKEYRADLVCGR